MGKTQIVGSTKGQPIHWDEAEWSVQGSYTEARGEIILFPNISSSIVLQEIIIRHCSKINNYFRKKRPIRINRYSLVHSSATC